jgi:hypothetical protein
MGKGDARPPCLTINQIVAEGFGYIVASRASDGQGKIFPRCGISTGVGRLRSSAPTISHRRKRLPYRRLCAGSGLLSA